MTLFSPVIDQLIQALRCLPGVGPKSAQRMAMYLLERDREGAMVLSRTLKEAVDRVGHCKACRIFSESQLCGICSQQQRDKSLLCIVETPADVLAIESGGDYRGLYFVLMGHLSPIDGIGPEKIGIPVLLNTLLQGEIKEIILATNPTVEGEATAHYIAMQVKGLSRQVASMDTSSKTIEIAVSRIAHGVPLGGELEFVDSNTLARAITGRQVVSF